MENTSRTHVYVWVGIGGAIGALARAAVLGLVDMTMFGHELPGLFVVNVTGSFLLGLFFALIVGRETLPPAGRAFVSVGLLGGFTTYSFLNYQSMSLMLEGTIVAGLINATVSVVAGLLAVVTGMMFGRLVAP